MILRFAIALILLLPVPALADSSALILSSVPGTPEHAERFKKWADGTRKALIEKFGFSPDRVILLSDKQATKAEIQKAFSTLKLQIEPPDAFFLFFIGHGSFAEEYKFNIQGADFTAAEYSQLLTTLNAGRIVVINGTSASGGAIEALAGKNRVIVTATRSGQEANETVFYEHFLAALEKPESDEDKDRKVSVWETFKYAAAAAERFYKEEGRLATEHPQISDNGSPKTDAAAKEIPNFARSVSFQVERQVASNDPKVQALLDEKREIEKKLEALRLVKDAMPEPQYEKEMEDLLVQLALKNQQIREQEKKK